MNRPGETYAVGREKNAKMPARHLGLSSRSISPPVFGNAHCRRDGSRDGPTTWYGPARPNQVRKATAASETSHRPFWTAQIAACVRFLTPILRRITFT